MSELPPDLREALSAHATARVAFERLAPSHRKEYLEWIAGAKRPETRERRIAKMLETLRVKE